MVLAIMIFLKLENESSVSISENSSYGTPLLIILLLEEAICAMHNIDAVSDVNRIMLFHSLLIGAYQVVNADALRWSESCGEIILE